MLYVLTGNDDFALRAREKALVQAFLASHDGLAVERFDGEDASTDAIRDAIYGMSLLNEEKLVIIKNIAGEKTLLEEITDSTQRIPDTTTVILSDAKLDKRAKYYKQLKKTAEFEQFDSAKYDNLENWLQQQAHEANATIDVAAARELLNRIGTNKTMLAQEVQKLALYDPRITKQTVNLLSEPTPQSTVFQLVDAVFAGKTEKAIELYDEQRQQRVEPLAMLGMIAWQLQVLAFIKTAQNKDDATVAKEAKLNPFVIRKNKGLARHISLAQLKDMVGRALQLDVDLKSKRIDPDESMRHFLVTLTTSL